MNTSAMVLTMLLAGPGDYSGLTEIPRTERRGELIVVPSAAVTAKRDVLIPATEAGMLSELAVEEGDTVAKMQAVGSLDTQAAKARTAVAQAEYDRARLAASSRLPVEAAERTAAVAEEEAEELKEVNRDEEGAIPTTQVRRADLQADRANVQAKVAEHELELAFKDSQTRLAQVQQELLAIKRHEIVTQQEGVVAQVLRRPGEWLQPGDPLLRVVHMQTLRMEALLPVNIVAQHEVLGRPVKITVSRTGDDDYVARSYINHVDVLVDNNGYFRVRADVANQTHPQISRLWEIYPGLRARIEIDLSGPRQLAPAAAPPGPGAPPAAGQNPGFPGAPVDPPPGDGALGLPPLRPEGAPAPRPQLPLPQAPQLPQLPQLPQNPPPDLPRLGT